MGERRVEYMPLPLIEAAPRNPKRHAGDAIKSSIDRFGLAELPLIDERTGRLVAGHGRLDRRCVAAELEPVFADVICRRFQEFTGIKPVLASTGEPHDFIHEQANQ